MEVCLLFSFELPKIRIGWHTTLLLPSKKDTPEVYSRFLDFSAALWLIFDIFYGWYWPRLVCGEGLSWWTNTPSRVELLGWWFLSPTLERRKQYISLSGCHPPLRKGALHRCIDTDDGRGEEETGKMTPRLWLWKTNNPSRWRCHARTHLFHISLRYLVPPSPRAQAGWVNSVPETGLSVPAAQHTWAN